MADGFDIPLDAVAVAYRPILFDYDGPTGENTVKFLHGLQAELKALWPSFEPFLRRQGIHTMVLASNKPAIVGALFNGKIAAVWLVSRSETYRMEHVLTGNYADQRRANMADTWCSRVVKRFETMLGSQEKLGILSTGEPIFCPKV